MLQWDKCISHIPSPKGSTYLSGFKFPSYCFLTYLTARVRPILGPGGGRHRRRRFPPLSDLRRRDRPAAEAPQVRLHGGAPAAEVAHFVRGHALPLVHGALVQLHVGHADGAVVARVAPELLVDE